MDYALNEATYIWNIGIKTYLYQNNNLDVAEFTVLKTCFPVENKLSNRIFRLVEGSTDFQKINPPATSKTLF